MTNLRPVISVEIDIRGLMMAIDRLPSGAFRARVRIAGRSYAQTFKTERAAREWETLTQARHLTGTLHGPITVAEYAQVWLGGYEAAPAATMKFHATNLRLHILPAIGGRPIAKITPTDITGLLVSVQARISAAKADSVYRTLSALFRSAEQDDLCNKAPTRSKKHRPRRQKPEIQILERHEARLLLPRLVGWQRDTALLQLALGARFGEIAGLTPHDVRGGTISIVRRVSQVTVRATKNHRRRFTEGYEATSPGSARYWLLRGEGRPFIDWTASRRLPKAYPGPLSRWRGPRPSIGPDF